MEGEWNKRVSELELLITNRRQEAHTLLDQLASVNGELAQLKVESQSNGYRLQYEGALKEVYDTHQFDNRLRRMNQDIELSQGKAQILREELQRVTNQWAEYYEEAIRGLRLRIEEMNGQV